MNRTRWIFAAILAIALIIVGVSLLLRATGRQNADAALTVARPASVTIRVLTALPVEPWVRSAAAAFNAEKHVVDGATVQVDVVATDGLTALGRWDRNE